MFPPAGYYSQCRALLTNTNEGGDDDHQNVWYFAVDPALASHSSAPDFFIHLYDADHHATGSSSGTLDIDPYSQASASVFEYRLYGGPGAATNDELAPGLDPLTWAGTLIDIDSDANDDTLRTDDPDDNDNNSPEDLRDQGYTLIAVDIDANPGEMVNGFLVYKLVVDGTFGPGGEWNRYRILATNDAARTAATGVQMFVYELTYAGRPTNSRVWTNLGFRVPPTPDHRVDLQTLDLDRQLYSSASQLTTGTSFLGNAVTFESGDQYSNSTWRWSSVNQQATVAVGNGRTGYTVDATGQTGLIWVFDADPAVSTNPFSVRLMDSQGGWLPMFVDPVFTVYGSGTLGCYGAGLPRPGVGVVTLFADTAPANALGVLLFGPQPDNQQLVVPPFSAQILVQLATATTLGFGFDGAGAWSSTVAVPPSLLPGYFYAQVLALDVVGNQLLHSNGLSIRLVP